MIGFCLLTKIPVLKLKMEIHEMNMIFVIL